MVAVYAPGLSVSLRGQAADAASCCRSRSSASASAFAMPSVSRSRLSSARSFSEIPPPCTASATAERALKERDGGVLELRAGPLFQPLRQDPRYVPLLRRIGLSDEQVAALDFNIAVPAGAQ
jgi:hypothetical protein